MREVASVAFILPAGTASPLVQFSGFSATCSLNTLGQFAEEKVEPKSDSAYLKLAVVAPAPASVQSYNVVVA